MQRSASIKVTGLKRARSLSQSQLDSQVRKFRKTNKYRRDVLPLVRKGRVETKFFDSSATFNVTTANQIFRLINGIADGDGDSDRTGNQINLKNVYLRYRVHADFPAQSAATDPPKSDTCRVMLVYDRQTNQALPSPNSYLTADNASTSMNNMEARGRYFTLYDQMHNLSERGVLSETVTKVIPLNTTTQFTGTNGAIANITNGALYLLILCESHSNNPAWSTVTYKARIRYTDP